MQYHSLISLPLPPFSSLPHSTASPHQNYSTDLLTQTHFARYTPSLFPHSLSVPESSYFIKLLDHIFFHGLSQTSVPQTFRTHFPRPISYYNYTYHIFPKPITHKFSHLPTLFAHSPTLTPDKPPMHLFPDPLLSQTQQPQALSHILPQITFSIR